MFDIPGLAKSIVDLFGGWLQGKRNTQKAKQDMARAEIENKARLLRDTNSNNHTWEMANLVDKDKWLRRLSFAMFSAPLILAIPFPDQVAYYFVHTLVTVPDWWVKSYMAITGGIWGISSLKNVVVGIVGELRK